MDTTPYSQPRVMLRTPATILSGVIVEPDGNFRACRRPLANSLTFVPPISTTSTFTVRIPVIVGFPKLKTCFGEIPLPPGEGAAKRRVRAPTDPHPALRATFSRREKDSARTVSITSG